MNKDEFKKLYVGLSKNYNCTPSQETFELWYEELEQYDFKYIKQVFKKLMLESKYMPSFNQVMQELKNIKCEPLTEEEKIEKFKKQGITPKWLGKEIKNEPMTQEELDEFNELLKDFKN